MSERKTPAEEILWRAEDDQALATLTPEQLKIARRRHEISSEALRDFDLKNAVKSQADMDRRISRMSSKELDEMIQEGDRDAALRRNVRV